MALGPVPVLAQLHMASGETLKLSAANERYLLENLSNSVTIEHLTMNGTAAHTISGTGTIGNFILNKTTGSTADNTVTITTGVGHMHSLTCVLTLTSGTLATNVSASSSRNAGYVSLKTHTQGMKDRWSCSADMPFQYPINIGLSDAPVIIPQT